MWVWMVGGDDDEEGMEDETKRLRGRRYGVVFVQSSTPFSVGRPYSNGKEEIIFCSFHNTKGKYEREGVKWVQVMSRRDGC